MQPRKTGTAIITITDEYGSITFTCNTNVSAIDSVHVTINSYNGTSIGSGTISNGFDTTFHLTNDHLNSNSSFQTFLIGFYTSSSTNTACSVYIERVGEKPYSDVDKQTVSVMTLNVDNKNTHQFKYDIYSDSSKSKKLGCLVLNYL